MAKEVELTTNFDDILHDAEIKIVVELMGGLHPAKGYISDALNAGKNMVTANKDLMATFGSELIALAAKNKCDLMYDASVAGGIPILRTLSTSYASDNISEIQGIINGTTNYILSQMGEKGLSYDEALKNAPKLGFVEADPTNDVTGKDAAYNIAGKLFVKVAPCLLPNNAIMAHIKNELMLCKLRVKVLAQRFLLDQVQVV